MNEQIETFLKSADLSMIGAIKSVCRKRYAKTVRVLDSLSDMELNAVKRGGLLSLPKSKITELKQAMRQDKFVWG